MDTCCLIPGSAGELARLLKDLSVLEPERGEAPSPGTAGVEADDVFSKVQPQRRPVSEDHRGSRRQRTQVEPRPAAVRRLLRRPREIEAELSRRPQRPDSREDVDDEAQPLGICEVSVPAG